MPSFRIRRNNAIAAILIFLVILAFLNYEPSNSIPARQGHFRISDVRSGIQYNFPSQRSSNRVSKTIERRLAVKREFVRAWEGYKSHAWMKDELQPVTGNHTKKFCGWAATLVDSLDTLWIMDLYEDFNNAVIAVNSLNFSDTKSCNVNLFETTIRHLGGILAAYDLSGGHDDRLLNKAREVGEMLYGAFETPNQMPAPFFVWPKKPSTPYSASRSTVIAMIGSLNLEFTRLSQVTGDPKYFLATERVMDEFLEWQTMTSLPGIWPIMVDSTGEDGFDHFPNNLYTLGALSDSLYEYLPKQYLLLGTKSGKYHSLWEQAVDVIDKNLLFRPMTPDEQDILFSGDYDISSITKPYLRTQPQHLACFQGGMFALSAKLFDRSQDLETAAKLTNGCIWAYQQTPTGIMPEIMEVVACSNRKACPWIESLWTSKLKEENLPKGITKVTDRRYILRPEAIESIFIMYRLTGKQEWREKGWKMFQAIVNHTRTDIANSAIDDVMNPNPKHMNEMESFWLAETLKYFYLLFSDPDLINLDEFVLNTEAHPFRLTKNPVEFLS
ncbi:MAG: hypothetical protein M1834_007500 [Cirrosporium novae-zelandiae]|nr:MAG: hypothetical protein M1834_007500 [Cirrosporium novae-zelandiae]